jgi:hypothetical protein
MLIATGRELSGTIGTGVGMVEPEMRPWLKTRIVYDWGNCNSGEPVMRELAVDMEGNESLVGCFDIDGDDPPQPLRGAERACPGSCGI